MEERYFLQELTKKDRVSVILYRTGIWFIGLGMLITSILMLSSPGEIDPENITPSLILYFIYIFTGISVLNIHLYIGRLKRILKGIYYIAIAFLIILIFTGSGNPLSPLTTTPFGGLLLLPLSLCIAFIGAKEAYCFNLIEGFMIALFLPLYVLLFYNISHDIRIYGLMALSTFVIFLAIRKSVMPLSFDIGDKSKYIP